MRGKVSQGAEQDRLCKIDQLKIKNKKKAIGKIVLWPYLVTSPKWFPDMCYVVPTEQIKAVQGKRHCCRGFRCLD